MIHNSDELNRRTLTFPAVKPCPSVTPSTLITSLLSLSSQITDFKPHDFTSNKRNATKTIRLIQILQVILEEIRDVGHSGLPKPAMESLSDLHVILQKTHFLLQVSMRPDARVWMLINSGPVSGHFRALIGSLADALEAFPVGLIGDEVGDYVSYVISKGKGVRFEVESDDLKASNVIVSTLEKFENRVIPNPNDLRRVMDYLGIKKWSDCNKQVKFLEDEIGSGSEPGSSLLGLMVYCRCVLFHVIDDGDDDRKMESKRDLIRCLNPDDFKCPISLEIMSDPVTVSSGQSYDRGSIVKWFKSGNPVCPKTGQKHESLDLVPNLALKEIIKQYCVENGINLPVHKSEGKDSRSITKSGCVGSLAAEEATKMVADFLSIKLMLGTTMAEKNKAAYEIRLLAKRSAFNRACFVDSGAIPYLLNLLRDSTAQENSIAALLNLSKHAQSKAIIVDNGGLALVVGVLKSGFKIEARQHAAATLFYLSSVEEYRRLIGTNQDAIPSLVELIRAGGDRGKRNALVTIFCLLLLSSNHHRVLEARLVPVLASALDGMESEGLIVDSLAVLAALAEKPDGARAILRARALNIVVSILCSSTCDSSRVGREHCVSILLALCINCGREVVEVLVKNTSLTDVLYSLLREGTSRASKKASSLISVLHQFSERSLSPSMAHALPHENFIHVW